MKREMHKFTVDLTKSEHRNMKSFCAKNGISMRQFMRDLINKHMAEELVELECCKNRSYVPNKETEKALKNARHRKDLVEFDDIKDVFKKIRK